MNGSSLMASVRRNVRAARMGGRRSGISASATQPAMGAAVITYPTGTAMMKAPSQGGAEALAACRAAQRQDEHGTDRQVHAAQRDHGGDPAPGRERPG